jgi:hypothetical protein
MASQIRVAMEVADRDAMTGAMPDGWPGLTQQRLGGDDRNVNETVVSLSIFANVLDSKHDDAARTLHRTP